MLLIEHTQKVNQTIKVFLIHALIISVKISTVASIFYTYNPSWARSPVRVTEAVMYIGSINRGQQAYYIEYGKFADSIDKLGLGIKTKTAYYNFSTRVQEKAAFNYGVARNKKLKSYIGGVFLVPATNVEPSSDKKDLITLAILCEADSPGINRLSEPTYRHGKTLCGANTHEFKR